MGHKYIKEEDTFSISANGTVPKPTAQDVTDGKVLGASGQWVAGGGGGGGSGHTYSTSEQVVGTWIDRKPIYERTWDLKSDVIVGQWTTVMSITGLNIDKIINSISIQNDPAISMIEYWVDGNTLKGNTLRNNAGNDYVRYLTLQYTKTTD